LLREKEAIEDNAFTRRVGVAYPHIMKLRFDEERSHPGDLPAYVRKPVYQLLAAYADGAVQRRDKRWVDVSPEELSLDEIPYRPLQGAPRFDITPPSTDEP
jgi:hypothetical protein